jgi:hypothetical protein
MVKSGRVPKMRLSQSGKKQNLLIVFPENNSSRQLSTLEEVFSLLIDCFKDRGLNPNLLLYTTHRKATLHRDGANLGWRNFFPHQGRVLLFGFFFGLAGCSKNYCSGQPM